MNLKSHGVPLASDEDKKASGGCNSRFFSMFGLIRTQTYICWVLPVHPKGDQSWVFIGRTDAKAETPVLWPPHVKSWLIGKDPDAGRDWGQEEKGTTEDEMAGWHHRLDGHESEWTPGVGDGQGGLACCDSWGCKESDTTERLNWTELRKLCIFFFLYVSLFQKRTNGNPFYKNYTCEKANAKQELGKRKHSPKPMGMTIPG